MTKNSKFFPQKSETVEAESAIDHEDKPIEAEHHAIDSDQSFGENGQDIPEMTDLAESAMPSTNPQAESGDVLDTSYAFTPQFEAEKPADKSKPKDKFQLTPFGKMSNEATLPPAILTILMGIGVYLAAAFVSTFGALIGMGIEFAVNPIDITDENVDVEAYMMGSGYVIVLSVLTQFIGMLAIVYGLMKLQKVSLKEIGLKSSIFSGQMLLYVVLGFIFSLVMIMIASFSQQIGITAEAAAELEAQQAAMDMENFDFAPFMQTANIIFMLCVIGFFIFQASTEEFFIRGWMMTTLSARSGIMFGFIASSIFFGLMHFDRFLMLGFAGGLYAITVIGSVGYLCGAVAIRAGSLIPAMGLHVGYNIFIAIMTLVAGRMTGGWDISWMEIFTSAMAEATDATFTLDLMFFVRLAVNVALPISLGTWLVMSTPKRQQILS